ncbi:hypothetical protein Desku_1625 [Desulfofundulus kuznetsovii DSM 6115]|uniref:Transposase n=1 Tax=Desulfofundulus kuznetsovii (strain DSM 6115 / VKM B-1805 / 17) TaxID=760568 RepID=A0AAU8PPZ4_DESK7|nr:hypothetical protein Desku_1625 [Desulfofundulus kuznetsovii DSM 6115]
MYVFGIDKNGRLGAIMSKKTAEKVVAAGRAKWVGLNVVQFSKIYRRPIPMEKLLQRGIPMPDTARPEVVWVEYSGKYEVADAADKLRGKYAQETVRTCQRVLRQELKRPDSRTVAEVATAGELCQILQLDPEKGEKPVTVGYPTPPRQRLKRRPEEKPGPLTVIQGALPPIRRYSDQDIGKGLTGQARKTARRRAFKEISEIYSELRDYFYLPKWGVKIHDRYVTRSYLLDVVQNLIDRLWGTPMYWKYRRRLEAIVQESQAPTPTSWSA